MRTEPPPSDPGANGTSPAATAAALPPEDPPGAAAEGVRIARRRRDPVLAVRRQPELRHLGLAQRHHPRSLERGDKGAVGQGGFVVQGGAAVGGDDAGNVRQVLERDRHPVQRAAARFAVPGGPGRGIRSAAAASSRACSAVTVMKAPRCLFSAAIRSRKCPVACRADSSPERRASRSSTAESSWISAKEARLQPFPGPCEVRSRGTCPFLGVAGGHIGIMSSARGEGRACPGAGARGRTRSAGLFGSHEVSFAVIPEA